MVGVKIECEGVKDMFVVVDRNSAGWDLGFT